MNDFKNILLKRIERYSYELDQLKIKEKKASCVENRDRYHNLCGRVHSLKFILIHLESTMTLFNERRFEERRGSGRL